MKKWMIVFLASVLLYGCAKTEEHKDTEEQVAPEYSCRKISSYDYSLPVPPSEPIEESYYDDVLLAGDSRMGCMDLYGTHYNAEVDYVTSLNLLLVDTMKVDNNQDVTLMDVFQSTTKDNIYMLFGINEIRNPNFDAFGEQFQMIIDTVRNNNPTASLYLILAYHPEDMISNLPEPKLTEHLQNLNETIIQLALNNDAYYLDVDNGLTDENGVIRGDLTFDGLHFNPRGTAAFQEYLDTHVVRSEKYVKEVCE